MQSILLVCTNEDQRVIGKQKMRNAWSPWTNFNTLNSSISLSLM